MRTSDESALPVVRRSVVLRRGRGRGCNRGGDLVTAPRLLDLFCCEGGAAVGYHRAGFEVVGVDIEPKYRKRYPFEFHAADAIQFVREHGHEFDVIHASPPCQHASAGTRAARKHGTANYPALIPATREALIESGKPYVIENVKGADLRSPLTLCGTMFGLWTHDEDGTPLELWRHRNFESNLPLTAPPCRHGRWARQVAGSYGGARRDKDEARHVRHGGYVPSKRVQEVLLGIHWMTQYGLFQSVPPVYCHWIGQQVIEALEEVAA